MFIHFFCLCPLSLAIKLNFNISKVVYWMNSTQDLLQPNHFSDAFYISFFTCYFAFPLTFTEFHQSSTRFLP